MKMDLVRPCRDCPFLEGMGYLKRQRAREIAAAISAQQQTFACHKTVKHNDEGEHAVSAEEQHCAGALIVLEKANQPNQWMRISERLGCYDRRKLDMKAPVYKNLAAFIAGHGNGAVRTRTKKERA